jgi:oligopeptide/dipeptide ABC transporter ATP-binding protein
MSRVPSLRLASLSVTFPAGETRVPVVRDVSFDLFEGSCLAIVGESGSGKSMCCQTLLGIVPEPGEVTGEGLFWQGENLLQASPERWRRLRGAEIAMVFQDPTAALNPLMAVGRQIEDVIRAHHGGSRRAARARVIEVLREVGFPDPERRWRAIPAELSGGLRQRVAIAMALACRPKLIVADEATTNLDVSIQAQIIELLRDLKSRLGIAIIFVTHDLGLAAEIADEVLVMYAGHAVEHGPVRAVLDQPCHPYTLGLLRSAPTLQSRKSEPLRPIPGQTPSPRAIGEGAPFRSRCPVVVEGLCDREKPGWTPCGLGHRVACHRFARDGREAVL